MLFLYDELSDTVENMLFTVRHSGEYGPQVTSGMHVSDMYGLPKKAVVLSFIDISAYQIPLGENWISRLRTFCTEDILSKYLIAVILYRYNNTISTSPINNPVDIFLASVAGSQWEVNDETNPTYIPYALCKNHQWTDSPVKNYIENTDLFDGVTADSSLPFTYILTPSQTGGVARVHDKIYPGCVTNGRTNDAASAASRLFFESSDWVSGDRGANENICIEYISKRLQDIEAVSPTLSLSPSFSSGGGVTKLCPNYPVQLEFSQKTVFSEAIDNYILGTEPLFASLTGIVGGAAGLNFMDYKAGQKETWQASVAHIPLPAGVYPVSVGQSLVDGSGRAFTVSVSGGSPAQYEWVPSPQAPQVRIEYTDGSAPPVLLTDAGSPLSFMQPNRTLTVTVVTDFPTAEEPAGYISFPGTHPSVPLSFINRCASVDQTVLTEAGLYTITIESYTDIAGQSVAEVSRSFIIASPVQARVNTITSTKSNGSYKAGEVIDIRVQFDQAVLVNVPSGGTIPSLLLNSGGNALYTGGTGTSILTFRYTVQDGENTRDLDCRNSLALLPGAATISAASGGQPAVLTVPIAQEGGSLAINKDICIDTVKPELIAISGRFTRTLMNRINRRRTLELTLTFSEVVFVNTLGTTIELQTTDKPTAKYKSGSGSKTLVFTATIDAANFPHTRENVIGKKILCIKGYIRDAARNNAIMTVPKPSVCDRILCGKPVACGLPLLCSGPISCNYRIIDEIDPCLFKLGNCIKKLNPVPGGDYCPTITPRPDFQFEEKIREIVQTGSQKDILALKDSPLLKELAKELGPAQTKNLISFIDAIAKETKR